MNISRRPASVAKPHVLYDTHFHRRQLAMRAGHAQRKAKAQPLCNTIDKNIGKFNNNCCRIWRRRLLRRRKNFLHFHNNICERKATIELTFFLEARVLTPQWT